MNAHRVQFFVERPVEGATVFVKPEPTQSGEMPVCTICGELYSNLVKHMREAH